MELSVPCLYALIYLGLGNFQGRTETSSTDGIRPPASLYLLMHPAPTCSEHWLLRAYGFSLLQGVALG